MYDDIDMVKKEDVSSNLKPAKMKKNSEDLRNIMTAIENNINSFDRQLESESIFNICSGKSASATTFLLNVRENGTIAKETFIRECYDNPDRFDRPIKRNKLLTFVIEGISSKLKHKEKYVESLLMRGLNFAMPPKILRYEDYMLPFELFYRDFRTLDEKKDEILFAKNELRHIAYSSFKTYNSKVHKSENISKGTPSFFGVVRPKRFNNTKSQQR